MKKIIVLVALALAVGVGQAVAAPAGGDVNGPSCADIVDGGAFYFPTGTVNVGVYTAAPSCTQVTYTLYVLDSEGNQLASAASSGTGAGGDTPLVLSTSVDPSNPSVCIYVTTSVGNGKHVFDQAPDAGYNDAGCIPIPQNTSPGLIGFN